jgi:GntR family transcriptional repressor for pyruvate dehydrogenase complex
VLHATGDAVGDLWEIRLIVEPEIAAKAAMRASPDDLAALEAVLDRQQSALGRAEVSLEVDREFHNALARSSHNGVAVRVVELIGSLLLEGRSHFITTIERQQKSLLRHREILASVRAGNPDAARAAMLQHLQEVEAYIVASFVDQSTAPAETGALEVKGE